MIHYSSIKDAWGKKDMFKNNSQNAKFTNIYNPSTNCQAQITNPETTKNIAINPTETFSQKEDIKYDVQTPTKLVSQNEHFTQNNCAFMEHLQNCPFCAAKLKNSIVNSSKETFISSFAEHFTDPTTTSQQVDTPISTINLFGFEINITKDVLKVLFIIILIVIFILLLRMVNVTFKKTNNKYLTMPNEELLRLATQIKYIMPTISQL